MLDYSIVSLATIIMLIIFACANLMNHLLTRRKRLKPLSRSSIRASEGKGSNLLGLGSLLFWIEVLIFPLCVLSGFGLWLVSPPLRLIFPFDTLFQALGLVLLVSLVFSCSRGVFWLEGSMRYLGTCLKTTDLSLGDHTDM